VWLDVAGAQDVGVGIRWHFRVQGLRPGGTLGFRGYAQGLGLTPRWQFSVQGVDEVAVPS
jgi:hypothetical protein